MPDVGKLRGALIRLEPLLMHPETVTLIATRDETGWCSKTYLLEFAHGTTDRIAEHMQLQASEPNNYQRVLLQQVAARRAVGEMQLMDAECAKIAAPDRQWVFTTGAYRLPSPEK